MIIGGEFYNSQDVKPALMHIKVWMDEEHVLYIHNSELFSHKE